MGRPRAIQGEVERRLLSALESGLTVKLALEYAGVSHDAWADELKRNPGFAERATRARLNHLPVALDQIRDAGKQDFRAAKAWVEMVFRDDFGRRLELTGGEGGPVKVATEVTPAFAADALRLLGERIVGAAPESPEEPVHP